MIVVTGGAGFIGSNLVRGLNDRGVGDIIVVDNLSSAEKVKNLSGLEIVDYYDKSDFLCLIQNPTERTALFDNLTAILHQGACSDTMAKDGQYVMRNNFSYSKSLYHFCRDQQVPLIYASSASVYGDGKVFVEAAEYESTLNAYAYSKLLFDNYVRRQGKALMQCAGLRYFNVYGPREQHKARMASVAWHFFNQYQAEGKVRLFEGSGGYHNGEQRRDFISVEDVVKVNLWFLDNPDVSGIFNVGTGNCQSFNEVAVSVLNTLSSDSVPDAVSAVDRGILEYVPMPQALHGKYQSFTQANLENLRNAGYSEPFLTVEQGVSRYVDYLLNT